MPVHSKNLGVLYRRMAAANADGLVAGANVYRNAMTKALRNGYVNGEFDHGMAGVAGSVAVGEPQRDTLGGFIVVGTNIFYAKYWEFGFTPARGVFSPGVGKHTQGPIQFRRVEKWRPTLEAEGPNILAKYAAVYRARIEAGE